MERDDLGFTEIHVDARAGDVMAGAEGAAGPAQDVRHQPPGRTVIIYCNYGPFNIDATSKVVKAAGCYVRYPGFNTLLATFFAFLGSVHRHMNLYI